MLGCVPDYATHVDLIVFPNDRVAAQMTARTHPRARADFHWPLNNRKRANSHIRGNPSPGINNRSGMDGHGGKILFDG
jgi:hypothetical protein